MPEVTAKAYNTIGTMLEISEDGSAWVKLCPIKSFPQLGGSPEQIEITDMESETQEYIPGVQSVSEMTFSANYTLASYTAVKEKAKTPLKYRVKLGKDGIAGTASWEGQHDVYVNEGEVNGSIGMTITVFPSSKVTVAATASS